MTTTRELSTQTELARIADLLDRAGDGDAWHGPSLGSLLADLSAKRAAERPIRAGHSIWEIVRHIAVWDRVVARRLAGERVEPTAEEDWPPVPAPTDGAWQRDVEELGRARGELRRALLDFDERRLSEVVPGRSHSYYVMVHGVVQHDLYHAGQIAILKRAVS
jgi:uncharacterized damage-inducible protein DinB